MANLELSHTALGREADAIIVDFHGEATSEKYSMGHYLDGRVSVVVGTHTHVPTADDQILAGGAAYVTDLGMCGDYDSVIGMEKTEPLNRFATKMATGRQGDGLRADGRNRPQNRACCDGGADTDGRPVAGACAGVGVVRALSAPQTHWNRKAEMG